MEKRQNADVLPSLIDLKGQKVADIGCGEGALTRMMTRHGATVFGVECSDEQLARARAKKPAGNELYSQGVGEDLSFEDEKLDLVVFFNSLHHIAVDNQDKALAEASRVLKPGGRVYICEPVAEGEHFEMMRPVHDETDVRAAALGAIKRAAGHGLTEELEIQYLHTTSYPDFAAFRDRILAVNPNLAALFEERDAVLRDNFQAMGHETENGVGFGQPMQVNILVKAPPEVN